MSSALAGLVYAAFALFADAGQVLDGFTSLDLAKWVVLLSLSGINYFLRWYRWTWFFASLGYKLRRMRQALVYLAGFAFTTTPGKVGEAVRMLHLKRDEVRYPDSAAAFLAERALDLGAVTLLAAVGIAWLPDATFVVSLVAVATLAACAFLLPGPRRFLYGLARLSSRRLSALPLVDGVGASLAAFKRILSWRQCSMGLTIGLLAWGAEAIGLYFILTWLGQPIQPLLAAAIYSVGMLAGAISFVPGGLGTTEASMVAMLTLVGVPTADAVAATLICRVATLWFAVGLGLVASGWLLLPSASTGAEK